VSGTREQVVGAQRPLVVPSLGSFGLEGKTAIVTGASSGLGASLAVGLADAGANVVICARRVEKLEVTRAAVLDRKRQCFAVEADVRSVDDCDRVVSVAKGELGAVDILINNAGIGSAVPATRESPEDFRAVIDVNLMGSYWMAQASGRVMERGSSIVNIGSVLGSTSAGLPQAAYASSKAAIIGLTRDLAQQWTGRKGIRVNAVAPGFFLSELTAQYAPGYLDSLMGRIPAGRLGRADELLAAVVFLSSDAASYVSGVVLPVDGGLLTN
jgi:NAD(P)-dependent dehydrogenase (short-subunit alcohol dehydrogenase family)